MDPSVESALISAAATLVSVGGAVALGIVGIRNSRLAIAATQAATDKTVEAARAANSATITAAHDDVRHTLDATREGQIADLNSTAIDQLGSNMLDVRIGGVYALERVARDSASDHPTVMESPRSFYP